MTLDVSIKRVYDPAEADDGYRVLIDHIWPRGVSHERAHLDGWARELAPSDELRRWFDHVPERFDEFRARYRIELGEHGRAVAGAAPACARRTADDRLCRARPRAQQRRRRPGGAALCLVGQDSADVGQPRATLQVKRRMRPAVLEPAPDRV